MVPMIHEDSQRLLGQKMRSPTHLLRFWAKFYKKKFVLLAKKKKSNNFCSLIKQFFDFYDTTKSIYNTDLYNSVCLYGSIFNYVLPTKHANQN